MKNRFLVFILLIISLFLLLSAVSAEEMICEDSYANSGIISEDQSLNCLGSGVLGDQGSSDKTGGSDNSDGAGGDNGVDSTDDGNSDASGGGNTDGNSDASGGADGDNAGGNTNDDGGANSNSNSSNSVPASTTSTNSADNSLKVPYKFTSTKNVVSTYGKKVFFNVKVLNKQGKPIDHALVSFKFSGKTYKRYTNASGVCSLCLNSNAGKYTVYYYSNKISGSNTYTVKNFYKITTYKWNTGANVLKNKRIKANVPNSSLVKRIIKLAKSGTPVIMFKGGNGKKVFITAGCHGSEIPSQVAAMKLISYLESHAIKGTVYVMPFMNPKATAKNIRNYGVNLNSKANKKGTISYKTVKLIKKFKCNAYGDFHSSMPGGKPGKDVAMGTYKPTKKSAALAKYISKNAKVKTIIYKKAGSEYPGALEDIVSLSGIPAVTCEVLSPHGKIKKGSVNKSLLMMKTLLKYNGIIK